MTKRWPKEYFEQDSQVRRDLEEDSQVGNDFEQDSWQEEAINYSFPSVKYVEFNGFRLPCPIRREDIPTALRTEQSDSNLNETCDQTNREEKSVPYRSTYYTALLERKGSHMCESALGITEGSKDLCQRLLGLKQSVPQDSLFRDNIFEKTCYKIRNRNEARVIQNITRLIVPSAEALATYGATHLNHLIEGVNEGWIGNIPVEGPRPQPDYSVEFKRSASTGKQLKKLDLLIGSIFEKSFFIATHRMYFPFLTCEVKCSPLALDIADRQNIHSMTVALRALVMLFQVSKARERVGSGDPRLFRLA